MQDRDEVFDDANGDLAIGELENAVEKYRRCVELDPEFFDGWHALGMALMKLDRFPEAINESLLIGVDVVQKDFVEADVQIVRNHAR